MRSTGLVLLDGGPHFGEDFTTFSGQACISLEECAVFSIYDGRGNGIESPGGHILLLDSEEIARSDGTFTWHDRVEIGSCECPDGQSRLTFDFRSDHPKINLEWEVSKPSGETLLDGGHYEHPDTFFGCDQGDDPDGFFFVVVEQACIVVDECDMLSAGPIILEECQGVPGDDDFAQTGCVLPTTPPLQVAYKVSVNQCVVAEADISASVSNLWCPLSINLGNCSDPLDSKNIFEGDEP